MASPMGFYAKQGLEVEVVKTAGWAVIRDKTINKEYDAAHMLSRRCRSPSRWASPTPIPFATPAIENVNGRAICLAMKHKEKARSEGDWKGFKLAVPFDYSMHNYLLRYYLAGSRHRSRPGTSRSAPCRRRKWSPTCAPTISTASLRPTISCSAPSMTASASSTSCRRKSGTATLLRLRGQQGIHHAIAELPRRAAARDRGNHRLASKPEPQTDRRRRSRARQLSQRADPCRRTGADRHLCRRPRRREEGSRPRHLRSRSRGKASPCGC